MCCIIGLIRPSIHWEERSTMPMSNEKFYTMVQATLLKCIEVMQTKGKEYTESSDNKLANFEAESLETDVPVLDIIHIFSNKHQRAINNYRKTGQVESEALEMRFVDRINYLFLELAECIVLGYEPREEWLIEALESQGQEDTAEATSAELTPAPAPVEDGEPCCGHPGNEQCCENPPPAPPATEGEQRKKQQRRRPARPRIPPNDENIPIATPDRRFDPSVVAERAKRQRDE
jgi:hypothetical protein